MALKIRTMPDTVPRIFLLSPNFQYFPGALAGFVNYKKSPLGILYLAGYLRSRYKCELKICDAYVLNMDEDAVLGQIREFRPDIVGISVVTPAVGYARSIAGRIRQLFPSALIVFGGPHPSALPFENLDLADISVIGEGELTFGEIVEHYDDRSAWESIKGIAFLRDGVPFSTPERGLIDNLDSLAFPARDLLAYNGCRHIYPYKLDTPYCNTILTARGCGFNCNFCLNELMWKRHVRYRSLDSVLGEIDELVSVYDTSLLHIHDDNFTGSPGRVVEFCDRMRKFFPRLKWICHGRADSLSRELLTAMRNAGCVEMQIGVESGDDKILKSCNKGLDTEVIRRAFRLLKDSRINQWATFVFGYRGETRESAGRTIRFALELDPTYATFMFLSPFPGTRCFSELRQKELIKTLDWTRYNWHDSPVFETANLTADRLVDLRRKAYIRFYIRPVVWLRYLRVFLDSGQWRMMLVSMVLLAKFILGVHRKKATT